MQIVTEADMIRQHARALGDHPAVISETEALSYAELDERANQVANGLISLGLSSGGRIAILSRNCGAFFELLYGINRAGMTVLPLNWRLAAPEIAFILEDAEVECLFFDEAFTELVQRLQGARSGLRHVIKIGGECTDADGYVTWRRSQGRAGPGCAVAPEGVMIQFYTSGTTGSPKGVQISHRSSRAMRIMETAFQESWCDWSAKDVAIVALPNFHLSGTSWALQWLARGATCVVQPQVDPEAFLQAIEAHSVTQLFAVPTVIQMMLDSPTIRTLDISSLRNIFYGGMSMPAPLLRRAVSVLKCNFIQIYGMTENNGTVCYLTPQDHLRGDEQLLRACGRPVAGIDMRICDADGRDVPCGTVGEICIRSPSLMSGYWKRPDLDDEVKFGEYYRTGDAGYRDDRGYLYLVDRVKDMIVSGGENIYPAEVERVLLEHPAVAEIAIIGVPDTRWGEAVKAVIVRRDPTIDAAALIAFARDKIAGYKLPKSVDFVQSLPRNANGKVLKRELKGRYRSALENGS